MTSPPDALPTDPMPQCRDPEQPQLLLANARLVLEHEVVRGSLRVEGGRIAAIDSGPAVPTAAVDCEGDLIAPGLVELHTDNLERHLQPRPGVAWPAGAAVVAHDTELAGCGITTVFDALRVGSFRGQRRSSYGARYARELAGALGAVRRAGALRIRHRLHLRAEICSETLGEELDEFGPEDRIGILSLMDHTPGQRQFRELTTLRRFALERDGMSDDTFAAHVAELQALGARVGPRHRDLAIAAARRLGAIVASHDDTTAEHVAASEAAGARLAEFPTTALAAAECRARGIAVMMGAPNILRGGSHSGNVAAEALARDGMLDILSSDYAPAALLQGAMRLAEITGDLAAGLAAVTAAPARAAGLEDRGRLAPGLVADLVRVRLHDAAPVTRGVWVGGRRVA
jgi:alpha-D-ribose 1-methylphosphonate 5-triphosphate diphosphatase